MAQGLAAGVTMPRRRGGIAVYALWAAAATLLVLLAGSAFADAALPTLTGRVVDDASLLSAASQSGIESKLKTLEGKSGIQLVVATVKSLSGEEIEPYANRLFRAWRLGEKTKNNGVLLLVAPTERRARIEVGYGLEGTLTDALTKVIITNAMIPRFKTGDFQGGIERATDDVITVLSTDAAEWKTRPDLQPQAAADDSDGITWWMILLFIAFVVLVIYLQRKSGRGRGGGIFIPPSIGGSTQWSGGGGSSSGGGSSDDGGFSGGGGSSGGGGASGQW